MGRAALVAATIGLLAAGCATGRPAAPPRATVSKPGLPQPPPLTIVIDAGHGGKDPGTSHHGLREKDLTLDISRRLRQELSGLGFKTVMTRDRDEFLVLSRRPEIANRIPADLFVSVHVNANRSRRVSGIEVYYPRESVITPTASFPPGVQPADVALPSKTIKQILWDLEMVRSRRQSTRMASHICRAMRTRLGVRCRGVRGARFVVLREARMPAVLVEVGYVSNRAEATRLGSAAYRQQAAEAIAEGVKAFLRETRRAAGPVSVRDAQAQRPIGSLPRQPGPAARGME